MPMTRTSRRHIRPLNTIFMTSILSIAVTTMWQQAKAGQLQFTVINKTLRIFGCLFQRSSCFHKGGDHTHCRWGEGKAAPTLMTDKDWNNTGFCFIQWQILIQRPGLAECHTCVPLCLNDLWVRIGHRFLSLLNVNTSMLHFIVI